MTTRILKSYGQLVERAERVDVRIGKEKRKFEGEDRVERAKRFLLDYNVQQKFANAYLDDDDDDATADDDGGSLSSATVSFCVWTHDVANRRSESVTVDRCDLERIKKHHWWLRTAQGTGEPLYVYTSASPGRLKLHCYLADSANTQFADGNVLNCCRNNLVVPCIEPSDQSREQVFASTNRGDPFIDSIRPDLYLFDCGILIPNQVWRAWTARRAQYGGLIVDRMACALQQRYRSPPPPNYSVQERLADVQQLMLADNTELRSTAIGQQFCKHYMAECMLQAGYKNRGSIFYVRDLWSDADKMKRVVRYLTKYSQRGITNMQLWSAISVTNYLPSNFPPSAARFLYDKFVPRGGSVLDCCSGYFGRALGFWSASNPSLYVGVDPNSGLVPKYNEAIEFLTHNFPHVASTKRFEMLQCGAERDWRSKLPPDLAEHQFDFMLTSPPYFDVEVYSTDAGQSCNAYGESYATWRDRFLQPMLARAFQALKPGAHLALNVADTSRCATLVHDSRAAAQSCGNVRFVETINLPINRRPNSKQKEPFEPILIFRKQPIEEEEDERV